MIDLECCNCGRKYLLDEEDSDEIQNAFRKGWEFAIYLDMKTTCPDCISGKENKNYDYTD